jgi:hypothetical protein|tara:strand:+ start:912 stop:1061 length:150 start_codon:yes stop_codon:yes gene_type:complete
MKMVKMTTASGGEIECHPSQVESMEKMGWKVAGKKAAKKAEDKTEKEED